MKFILIKDSNDWKRCALVPVDSVMAGYFSSHNFAGVRFIPNKEEALCAYKNALEDCLKQVKKELKHETD